MSDPIWNEQSYERTTRDSILTARWFTITLAALAGIIGIIILYYLFYPSPQANEKQYVIESSSKPVKEKPENPGGTHFPHQDKMVYENLLGKPDDAKVEEQVVFSDNVESPLEIIQTPEKAEPSEETRPPLTVEEITPVIEKVVIEQPIVINETVEQTPKQEVAKTLQKSPKTPGKTSYRVQLAALPSKERVENAWRKMRQQHKKLFAGQKMTIENVSLPKKGTLYRLQIGQFDSRDDAIALCEKIKAAKGSCFVPK